jgi:hypothetical protein
MNTNSTNPRAIISTAWGGMLAILLAMLMLEPLRQSMAGTYEQLSLTLQHDPGQLGLQVLIAFVCLNAIVQVSVQALSCRTSKISILIISVLYGLFFLVHNLFHFAGGEQLGLQTLLDVTHHLLASVAIFGSWRWYKSS